MELENKVKRFWNILNTDVRVLSGKSIKKIIKSSERTGKINKKDAERFYNQLNNKRIIIYIDDFFVQTVVLNASGWVITGFILKNYLSGDISSKTTVEGLFWLGTYNRTMWTSYEILKDCSKKENLEKIPSLIKEFKTNIYNNASDIYKTIKYEGLKQGYNCFLQHIKSGGGKILRSNRFAALILGIVPYAGSGAYAAQIALGTKEERKLGVFLLKNTLFKIKNKIYKLASPWVLYGKNKNNWNKRVR